jgi:hypothetical protein
MSAMWVFKMQLSASYEVPFSWRQFSSIKTLVRGLFTKRTAWGHNLSQLGYYYVMVTIAVKYSGDIMGKTVLRLITTSQDQPGNDTKSAGNAPSELDLYGIGHGFHYWDGLTGARYLHSVYRLHECPELPKANYIMVRKLDNGEAIPLFIGQTIADATSLNLAYIRQKAAKFGANEIHIHVMTDSPKERDDVERDLLKGQFQRIENKLRAQAANG